jgi:Na+/glutamate symporter
VLVRTRWIIAAILIVVGAVWIGQGLGLIRGSSFMIDDIRWAIIGAVMLVGGFGIGWTAFRSRGAA